MAAMSTLLMRIIFAIFAGVFSITSLATEKEKIEVVSVEYPPYASKHLEGYGSVFRLMSEYASENLLVDLLPSFVPPARADKMMEDGDWCLSIYPPKKGDTSARFVSLSSDTVKLKLIRLAQRDNFEWSQLSELKGKSTAILRSKTPNTLQKKLTEAGVTLVYVGTVEQGLLMLLKKRVDFAFGDQSAMLGSKIGQKNIEKLQISQSSLHEAKIGFFYNTACEAKIFGSLVR